MKTERQDNQSGLGQSATEPVVEVITLQDEYDDSAKERFANVRLDLEEKRNLACKIIYEEENNS